MKTKKWLLLPVSLAVVLLASSVGITRSSFIDLEDSTGNTFQAWTSTVWVQTTEDDFNAGVLNQVDTSTSPGNVTLDTRSGWYDADWKYRKPITVTNSGSALSNYQVKITINTKELISAGKMQPDGGDIRFTASGGDTAFDYWIESGINTTTTEIWVKVPFLPSGDATGYVYYGNPAAPGASNGTNTFILFDDFATWSGWTDFAIGGGVSQDTLDGEDVLRKHTNDDPRGGYKPLGTTVSEFRFLARDHRSSAGPNSGSWDRYGLEDGSFNGYTLRRDANRSPAQQPRDFGFERRTGGSAGNIQQTPVTQPRNNWYLTELTRCEAGNFTATIYDDEHSAIGYLTGTDTTYSSFDRVTVRGGYTYYLDWVAVGKYVCDDPTTSSPGTEEGLYRSSGTIASQVLDTAVPSADWYDTDWSYRKRITVDHTKVDANLTNFPILISLSSDSDLASHAQSNGDDILFSSSDGTTKLSHEIEGFDDSIGKLIAWVKVPSLSGSTDTDVYMYYGNPACGNQEDVTGVWDGNFKMVQHLQESPNDDVEGHLDSTSNHNDGTPKNFQDGGGGSTNASGQIDGADDFAGDDDWVDCGEGGGTLDFGTGDFTLEAWVKTAQTETRYILSKFHPNAIPFLGYVLQTNNGKLCAILADGGMHNLGDGNATINDNSWHYLAVAFDRDGDATYYVDGTNDRTVDISSYTGNTGNNIVANIARKPALMGNGAYFHGIADEVRFSNIERSGDWIKTCYYNQNSPSTFYSLGIQENKDGSGATRWDALFWDETLEPGTDISFAVRASDRAFLKDAAKPFWSLVLGDSPITSGLPSGRYMQWRATLTTSDTSRTPTLREVRVYYSDC